MRCKDAGIRQFHVFFALSGSSLYKVLGDTSLIESVLFLIVHAGVVRPTVSMFACNPLHDLRRMREWWT